VNVGSFTSLTIFIFPTGSGSRGPPKLTGNAASTRPFASTACSTCADLSMTIEAALPGAFSPITFGTRIVSPLAQRAPGLSSRSSAGLAWNPLGERLERRGVPEALELRPRHHVGGDRLERPGDIGILDRVLDEHIATVRGERVPRRGIDASGCPLPWASWKAATVRLMFAPKPPSISPGENQARSSRICARTTASPRDPAASVGRRALSLMASMCDRGAAFGAAASAIVPMPAATRIATMAIAVAFTTLSWRGRRASRWPASCDAPARRTIGRTSVRAQDKR
jgi:hypothetical protein